MVCPWCGYKMVPENAQFCPVCKTDFARYKKAQIQNNMITSTEYATNNSDTTFLSELCASIGKPPKSELELQEEKEVRTFAGFILEKVKTSLLRAAESNQIYDVNGRKLIHAKTPWGNTIGEPRGDGIATLKHKTLYTTVSGKEKSYQIEICLYDFYQRVTAEVQRIAKQDGISVDFRLGLKGEEYPAPRATITRTREKPTKSPSYPEHFRDVFLLIYSTVSLNG